MKAYLITTGTLFGLFALAHLWRTIVEWPSLSTDRWFILHGPGISLIGAGFCFWAVRLLRHLPRS